MLKYTLFKWKTIDWKDSMTIKHSNWEYKCFELFIYEWNSISLLLEVWLKNIRLKKLSILRTLLEIVSKWFQSIYVACYWVFLQKIACFCTETNAGWKRNHFWQESYENGNIIQWSLYLLNGDIWIGVLWWCETMLWLPFG